MTPGRGPSSDSMHIGHVMYADPRLFSGLMLTDDIALSHSPSGSRMCSMLRWWYVLRHLRQLPPPPMSCYIPLRCLRPPDNAYRWFVALIGSPGPGIDLCTTDEKFLFSEKRTYVSSASFRRARAAMTDHPILIVSKRSRPMRDPMPKTFWPLVSIPRGTCAR